MASNSLRIQVQEQNRRDAVVGVESLESMQTRFRQSCAWQRANGFPVMTWEEWIEEEGASLIDEIEFQRDEAEAGEAWKARA